jgi:hypothetical protein
MNCLSSFAGGAAMVRDIGFKPSQIYGSIERLSAMMPDTGTPCYEKYDRSAETTRLLHLKAERLSWQKSSQKAQTVFIIICEFGV